jgi:peptidyl-prolyl cis-trans isomerase SurA
MIHRLAVLALLAPLALTSVARAQDSTAAGNANDAADKLPMDRIVAVVGTTPILWSEVLEIINQRRAQGMQIPSDTAAQMQMARQIVGELVDEEVLVQRAQTDTTIVVDDADVNATVEQQIKRLRDQIKSDQEFLSTLRNAGFGTPEEYRRWLTEQARRRALSQRLVEHMRQEGKMISVAVTEDEITEAFERSREQLPKRPATITFRQIVIATKPSEKARQAARAKAESVLVEIQKGGDFESIAKRESQDPSSKDRGGDLGWNRRDSMVRPFDDMMFALNPGQVSPVVETPYGFHIIRVDRVKPGEVKARHILIKPAFDSTDAARARALADSVLAQWKSGVPYDSLVARYHDTDELPGSLEPFPRAQLPETYQDALKEVKATEFFGPFPIEDKVRGVPKYVLGQLLTSVDEGQYTVKDLRDQIRDQLQQEKSFRRLIDMLKQQTYVAINLDGGAISP